MLSVVFLQPAVMSYMPKALTLDISRKVFNQSFSYLQFFNPFTFTFSAMEPPSNVQIVSDISVWKMGASVQMPICIYLLL